MKNIYTFLFVCVILFSGINTVKAQQNIGVFPEINGSFSLQSDTIQRNNPFTVPQTFWTTQQLDKGFVRDTGGRSNPSYLEFNQNAGGDFKRLYTPTMGTKLKRNTTYTIQFYFKGDMDNVVANNQAIKFSLSPNALQDRDTTLWIYDNDTVYQDWQLLAITLTTPDVPETQGIFAIDAVNNRKFFIDDFVIYPDSFDILPPNDADSMIVNNTTLTSIDLSWNRPAVGLDSGGFVLVRYINNKPEDDDVLNFKGIYDKWDTVTVSNMGVIVYIGTDTNFVDINLSSSTEYWYKLYTVDKAFNYSNGILTNGFTLDLYPEITVVENLQDFGLVQVGQVSAEQSYTVSGIYLLGDLEITCPLPFRISLTSGSGFSNAISLTPTAGVVDPTTIYVRFEPSITGTQSADIINKTFAAPNELITLTGSGYKGTPAVQASGINCTDIGPRSMNVNWTNGDGDRRMVIMNTTNNFTNPIDSTYPTNNPQYAGVGEQIVYMGNQTNFNVYGLSPESQYWFRVYEYNNTDTLTKYLTTTYTLNPNTCTSGEMTDFFEDFELGLLDNYYADSIITLESGDWRFAKAMIGTTAQDKKRGGRAARIQKGGFIAMNFNKPNGIETISIYHGNYRQDQGGQFMVQYSTNNGQTFHSLGVVSCNAGGLMTKTTFDVMMQGNVRIVINAINGNRINIDDIAITDYKLTTWTGYENMQWHNINNWDNGIPNDEKDVLIPTTPPGNPNNFPVISTGANICSDIKIETGASLTINPNASLTVLGEFTALDSLIILSDETGIGSLITYDDYTGNAHVHKFIYGGSNTNYVGIPISNATSGVFNAALANNTLEFFTESTAAWTNINNNSTNLIPVMRGYNYKQPAADTVIFTGLPNNYNKSLTITRTASTAYEGYNLVANPYPSGLNWNSDSLNKDSLVRKTYWTNFAESFAAYNGNARIGCPEQFTNLIPTSQSFFVKLDTPYTSALLKFKNDDRKHHIETPDTFPDYQNIFRMAVNQQSQFNTDEMVIAFFDDATDTLDKYDSDKLFSLNTTVPQIFTYTGDKRAIINSQTPIIQYKAINLGFKTNASANFTFTPKLSDYDVSLPVFLEDKQLVTFTDLRSVPSYSFSSGVTNDTTRFILHFYPCYFSEFDFTYDTLYCQSSGGVTLTLNGSETDVNYQLYKNGSSQGTPVAGTGMSLVWNNVTAGVYTIVATHALIPACFKSFSDTAVINEIALPIAYAFSAVPAPTYCEGTSGGVVAIANSEAGVFYQLSKDGVPYGAQIQGGNGAIVWDSLTVGSYSLIAYTNTIPVCQRIFQDTIDITMIPSPATFDVTSAGTSCEGDGGWILLQSSELNVNYQLQKNGLDVYYAYTGTGSSILWENIFVSGFYYIIGTSTVTGCSVSMNDTVELDYIMSPTAYDVIGGGTFCEGQGAVGIQNSQTNVYYQLVRDLYYNEGGPVQGIGSTLWWNNLSAGFYSVTAYTPTTPQCDGNMSGVVEVIEEPGPNVYNVSAGGSYCNGDPGITVFLSGSEAGVSYQLFKNGSPHGTPITGTGFSLSWPDMLAGNYTVTATDINPPNCSMPMNGTAIITEDASPTAFTLSGTASYCQGGAGVTLTLSGSETGVYYQLFKNSSPFGVSVDGTGNQITWNNMTAGSYTVNATFYAAPYCTASMNGTVTITETPAPTVYNLSGGGSFCAGGTGLSVTLNNSQNGINYQLKKNGSNEGSPVGGTGGALVWNNMQAGTYTVTASAANPPYCSAAMNGSVVISEMPSPAVYSLSGGGSYCSGSSAPALTLSGSQTGVSYQLKKDGTNHGSSVLGNGSPLTWNSLGTGTYTVVATASSAPYCSSNMTGSIVITQVATPFVYDLTGSGSYCEGTSGLTVTLNGSETGVNYQLKKDGINHGAVVPGTGNTLTWNNLSAGNYTVEATTTVAPYCTATMSGMANITESSNPTVFNVSGGGSFCIGGTGLSVTLGGSQSGVMYQLKKDGNNNGTALAGSGNPITWNNLPAGTYTVTATMSAAPYCASAMNGQAVITEIAAPTPFNLTGTGSYCEGGTGLTVTLSGSQTGVNYQLKKNGVNQGAPVAGNGNALTWTNMLAGAYTAEAVNANPPNCTATMSGSVTISETSNPAVFVLNGGGSFCAGGTGLTVTLNGSQSGVNYQLKKNGVDEGAPVAGNGNPINWNNLGAGTYTAQATMTTSPFCASSMSGSVVVTEDAGPTAYTLSGGGNYCAGGNGLSITLNGSQTGVNYQLKKNGINQGSAVSGTGNPITWNNQTSGTYTVTASSTAFPYCTSTMNGSVVVTMHALPVVNAGTDQTIAWGTTTTLSATASGGSGNYNYQWTPQGMVVNPTQQTTLTQNITSVTQFIVTVQDLTTTCANTDTMVVYISGGPLSVTALVQQAQICEGDTAFLSAVASGGTGSYQYTWASNPAGLNSTNAATFHTPLFNTTYTVTVFDGFNTVTSTVNVFINPNPEQYNLLGSGSYCQGSSGNSVILNNSSSSVLYQLYQNGVPLGGPVVGTDTSVTWQNITQGTYMVVGTFDSSPYCSATMNGTITMSESPNPQVFNLSGNGSYCPGGTGLSISLSGSQIGINYQLLKNGLPQGTPMAGTGNPISWNNQTNGNYTVSAAYSTTPYCSATMNGTVVITIAQSPTVYLFTGSGSYCAGGNGLNATLSNSQAGISYQLYRNSQVYGAAFNGTGSSLVWNNLPGGIYDVMATVTNPPSCQQAMSGQVVISEVAVQTVSLGNDYAIPYGTSTNLTANISGGSGSFSYQWTPQAQVVSPNMPSTATVNLFANTQFIVTVTDLVAPYCANKDTINISITGTVLAITATALPDTICQGDTVILSASASGGSGVYNYSWSSNPAGFNASVGNTFAIPLVNTTYTAVVNDNYNIASVNKAVVVRPLPQLYTLSQGGFYCPGTNGLSLSLSGTQSTCTYQLLNNGSAVGSPVAGTGGPITWNNLTAGTYTIEAVLNINPWCSRMMQGSATITQHPDANVVFNPITPVCLNAPIFNLVATPAGGTFSGIGVTGNNFNPATAGIGNHIVTYNFTDNNNCSYAQQRPALIYDKPIVTFTTPADVCVLDTPFVMTGGSPLGGYYAGAGITNDTLKPSVAGVGSHQIIYYYTDVNNCSNNDTAFVQVNTLPIAYMLSTPGYFCTGTAGTTLSLASSETGVSYQLYKDGTPTGQALTGTGNALTWNNLMGGQYHIWAYYTTTPNCKTFMSNIVMIGEIIPQPLWLGNDTTLCMDQSIELSAHVGYTYYWIQLPDDTLSITNTLMVDSLMNGSGTQTYVAILIDNHNCMNSDTIDITFDDCVYILSNDDYHILMYPNPASDMLYVEFAGVKAGVYKVEIRNMLGQTALEQTIEPNASQYLLETSVKTFTKGIYQLSVYHNGNPILTRKLVVN